MLIIAILSAITSTLMAQSLFAKGTYNPYDKMRKAALAISALYVDTVDDNKLAEDAIRGMIENLDPHSSYSTAKQARAFNESLGGSFDGIGVQFNISADTLLVIKPVVKGPSEKVGIMAGDRIISVNDTAIAGVKMDQSEIMRRLRGKRGTMVRLGVVRRGIAEVLYFDVKRDKIPLNTIDAAYMIRPQVGYIRIGSFGAYTYKEFMDAVKKLNKEGMKNLILDLQENGGGYMLSATQIVNEFLGKNDLIVYTEGRNDKRREYHADGNGKLRKIKVVVLVNEFSASASEIVSGALQDQDRGVIVGRRTFGKGLVQRPIEFPDGSMMRLTIAHYYTPSGRCIQKPYKKGELADYEMDIENRYKHGEFYSADSIHFADSLKYYTLRKHRTVYGGGGIMPDYFVPLDTTQYTPFHRNLVAKNVIISQDLKYMDNHRKELKAHYPTFDSFFKSYEVPQSLLDSIFAEGKKLKVTPKDDAELTRTLPSLKLQLKALIARDLWDMSEYFQVINTRNNIVQQAVKLIEQ